MSNEDQVLEHQRNRRVRGTILRLARRLYAQAGVGVEVANFHHVAGERQWTAEQISEQVRVLVDKGYLAALDMRRDALDKTPPEFYRLTARGMDFLNGDLEDRSIEL